jgi:predicted ATP-grasp superfamily ATP-dependent carboligase
VTPGAIVVGAHVNGLGVIRALGPKGVPIVSISTRPFDIAQYSRWVREHHRLPELHERRDTLVELLEHHADRWKGSALFPTNDDALIALAQHHERLSKWYRLTCPPWDVAARIVDKDGMHALAIECGIDVPVCHGTVSEVLASPRPLDYPVFVKPVRHDHLISMYGVKLFVADGPDALERACRQLAAAQVEGLVFAAIPGPDTEIFVYCLYVGSDGQPSAGVTVRKLRQNPPFTGGARAAKVVDEIPSLRDASIALLRRAGFQGLAFIEFKRDPRTGRFLFIEVNGRAVLFNSILPPTGLDLVGMAWADVMRKERRAPVATAWRGAWIHLQADVLGSIRYRRHERLGLKALAEPYLGPKTFAVWSLSDPRPFAAQSRLMARRAFDAARGTRRHGTSP